MKTKKLKCGFANGKCVGTYVGKTSGGHRACKMHLEIYEKNKR